MNSHAITPSAAGALAIAAALAAGLCLLFWLAVPAPLLSRHAKISQIRQEIVTLEKQRLRLGELDRWTKAREEALTLRSDFLLKKGDASSSALIQGQMREAANEAGLSVISTQDYAPANSGAPAAGVRMNVAGDLNAVAEFLMGLSQAKPKLFVEDLVIRPKSGEGADAEFSATVTAVAFYWSREA